MRKVIGIGETVLDIIFRDDSPIAALPGGSTYNAMISLGRSGVDCTFISEVGDDRVGDRIVKFLQENGVDSQCVCRFRGTKSPLSLAFLNDKNNAEYIFYKDHPNDQLDFEYPQISPDDIVLFGSFYAVNPVIRHQVSELLRRARQAGAIIYYDVNFRPSHQNEVVKIRPQLLENFEYADIVRGSNEDFHVLFGKDSADEVYNDELAFYCKTLIYTQGADPVEVRWCKNNSTRRQEDDSTSSQQFPVASTNTVSTIGAGDNFNAGFIFGLISEGISRHDIEQGLSAQQWSRLIKSAQAFSADCCKDIYNYVSVEFGKERREQTK